jgi:hypothetical protein
VAFEAKLSERAARKKEKDMSDVVQRPRGPKKKTQAGVRSNRRRRKIDEVKAAAYHEAGHAVIAWHLRLRVKHLWVDEHQGACELYKHRPRVNDFAIYLLAGQSADVAFRAQEREGKRTPWDALIAVARSRLDREQLRRDLEPLAPEEREMIQKLARVRAEALVEFYWPAVTALAEELLMARRLTGQRVTKIIEEKQRACGARLKRSTAARNQR